LLHSKKYFLSLLPGLLAITYKDNTFLILAPLAIAVLAMTYSKIINYFYLFLLITLGLTTNMFFNTLKSSNYFDNSSEQNWIVVDPLTNINNFFALWLSPSGGVLGYFYLLPLILLIYLIKNLKIQTFRDKLVVLLLIFSVFLVNLNLALWFSPFGWVAWGPRLFLPALVIFSYVVFLYLNSNNLKISYFFSKWWNYLFFIFSYFMFLSVAGFLINPGIWNKWYSYNISTGKFCPEIPIWEVNSSGFLECSQVMMWSLKSLPLFSIYEIIETTLLEMRSQSSLGYLIFAVSIGVLIYFISLLKENIQEIRQLKNSSKDLG
jgi:hypothetical protein